MERRLSIVLKSEVPEIERLAETVEEFGHAHGLNSRSLFELNLALEEIVVNVIHHGYADAPDRSIRVDISVSDDDVEAVVEDDARPFNPLSIPPPDLEVPLEERPIGGMGVHLARRLMSSVDYERINESNRVTLRKTIK